MYTIPFKNLIHIGCFANTIPPPRAFADGSSGVGVKRQEPLSRSQRVGRDLTTTVKVQARAQKAARPRKICVIPKTPEQKRPRQSDAWDECDMNLASSVKQEAELNQPPEISENAVNPDVDADNLPSNQEDHKNQLQNHANK
ncbi:K(+) efflux antiporter 3, chloroplastic [Labeo rohita]|uniref:K(+) efflux antiporter 3, chloroplastic n=1 Tax=Labeo rohita TaxID=84645 RepID=A0ABQ8L869_LABRO|nr:K(+) efflux antiporter 3, chloroplastic [Labeo rohita]